MFTTMNSNIKNTIVKVSHQNKEKNEPFFYNDKKEN
jgi:hypothetical protein